MMLTIQFGPLDFFFGGSTQALQTGGSTINISRVRWFVKQLDKYCMGRPIGAIKWGNMEQPNNETKWCNHDRTIYRDTLYIYIYINMIVHLLISESEAVFTKQVQVCQQQISTTVIRTTHPHGHFFHILQAICVVPSSLHIM